MKRIPLTRSKFTLVDDADYDWLNQRKWYAYRDGNSWYARHSSPCIDGKQFSVLMHRQILGLKHGDGKYTDHIDHNGLNNQRSNLRICTNQQNGFNQKAQVGRSSNFRGVCWNKKQALWVANIKFNGRQIWLGGFSCEIDAAIAYDNSALKYFGEFARLNLSPLPKERRP